MKFIDEKKINKYIVIAVLFLSFGYAKFQHSRGVLAYAAYSYGDIFPKWLANDAVALLMGGVIPLLFYEIITLFASRFISARIGGDVDKMKYALRFFYIAANVVIGSLKFVYYISPVISVFGEVLIDFVVTTVFFCLFLWYGCKHYIVDTRWGAMMLSAGGAYLVVEAVIVVFNLVGGLLL